MYLCQQCEAERGQLPLQLPVQHERVPQSQRPRVATGGQMCR